MGDGRTIMAHIKQLQNKAYISKRLKEKLNLLENYRFSFICAPSGYGKTIVSRTFFKNYSGYTVLWLDGKCTSDLFFNSFCNVMRMVNSSCATALKNIGNPTSDEDVSNMLEVININAQSKEQTFFIIDNFDNISNEYMIKFIKHAYSSTDFGIKTIMIIKELHDNSYLEAVSRDEAGYIGKEELKFSSEDIVDYYRLNELIITNKRASEIYNASLGWPFVIHSWLSDFCDDSDEFNYDKINLFIENNVWEKLNENKREFLMNICVFNEFTVNQCAQLTKMTLDECRQYLNELSLIDYNSLSMTYKFNPIFKHFVESNLNKKAYDDIRKILINAADTQLSHKEYFNAYKLYSKAREYTKIYRSEPDFGQIYRYITKENKDMFLDIANNYYNIDKQGKYKFSIIICFSMFLYNVKSVMASLLKDIENDISEDESVSEEMKINYLAELSYISAYTKFNDFNKMDENFQKIFQITKTPVSFIAGQYPFTFEYPSCMSLYHKQPGALDLETLTLENCAPNYYRITNGHGKGFEALMKAEVLYNRGDFDGAEILCHKCIYMADSRNQNSIYMAASYLLALISINNGNNDAFKEYMNNIAKKVTESDKKLWNPDKMSDMCKGLVYCNLDDTDNVAEWLTDEKLIEDNTNFIALSHCNIILGKYLILKEQYHHFLGISGQFLGLCRVYPYVMPKLYTYIYLAIANYQIGNTQKGLKFLSEAVELAEQDNLYMPFVHNFSYLDEMFEKVAANKEGAAFIKNVIRLNRTYDKGKKTIQKSKRLLANYGLTVRETDVAKLAAMRLTNKEIAEQLFIAESTVKSNMKVIFNKLRINSRSELKNFFD